MWRIEGRPAPDTRIRRATIWVTDDARHVPLRVQSKVFFDDLSKQWFVDSWLSFGVTPNRAEFAATIEIA